MAKRHIGLSMDPFPSSHCIADEGDFAGESVLIAEDFEEPADGMALFSRGFLVIFKDLMNNRQEPIDFLFSWQFASAISWWFRVRQDFLKRVPVNVEFSAC